MILQNYTLVTDFVLVGLVIQDNFVEIIFSCFFLIYIINLAANFSIMVIAMLDVKLHTPMYFFLWNLALLDICYSSVVVPKMLTDLMSQKKTISFYGCMLQVHFFHFLGSTEVLFFSAMSYDRYVAIAHPLRYSTIMSPNVCLCLASCSWVIGFLHSLLHTIMTVRLPFCGPNTIKHFFCDIKPVLELACANTSLNLKLIIRVTGTLVVTTSILTILSYICISRFLIKIKTSDGRKRALSTCSAHLCVVSLQYGTAIFTYIRPSTKDSLDQDRNVALLFTVFTPALNPIIYTLRNKDMKNAMKKLFIRSYN
ncbi:olfactory receptor 12D1-like [Leptodactylus fuscus]|uniref:olfactory receptor 12D1-like n=1 Tax=Leptodactylus fuscus TaxID=238119 RepID=UPI003F4E84E9